MNTRGLSRQVKHLERDYGEWYGDYLTGLSNEEYAAEFVRAVTREQGSCTWEDIEAAIEAKCGDLDYWRPVFEAVLSQCEALPARGGNGRRRRHSARQQDEPVDAGEDA